MRESRHLRPKLGPDNAGGGADAGLVAHLAELLTHAKDVRTARGAEHAARMLVADLASGAWDEWLYETSRLGGDVVSSARRHEEEEILRRVCDWAGGDDAAALWFRAQPLAAFGGRTAEALVKSGQAEAVRDYIDSLALGGFA